MCSCRVPGACVDQSGWRSVVVVAGGPVGATVLARRSASGGRYRPAMRRTRSAESAAGIPAAVTNGGRSEHPRTTGTAWVAVRNRDLATPVTGCRTWRAHAHAGRAGPAWVQVGVAPAASRPSPLRSSGTARSGGTRGTAAVRSASTCVKAASAARTAAAGRRRSSGSARPRRRRRRSPGACRCPCLEDARTGARHQNRVRSSTGAARSRAPSGLIRTRTSSSCR